MPVAAEPAVLPPGRTLPLPLEPPAGRGPAPAATRLDSSCRGALNLAARARVAPRRRLNRRLVHDARVRLAAAAVARGALPPELGLPAAAANRDGARRGAARGAAAQRGRRVPDARHLVDRRGGGTRDHRRV